MGVTLTTLGDGNLLIMGGNQQVCLCLCLCLTVHLICTSRSVHLDLCMTVHLCIHAEA